MDWNAPLSGSGGVAGPRWGAGELYDWPVPPTGRSSDPLSPYFVDPKIANIIAGHPSIAECLRRDAEIAAWAAAEQRWERGCRFHTALEGIPPVLFISALIVFIAGWAKASAVVALMIPLALLWRAVYSRPADPGLPPRRLCIVPFDQFENMILLSREQPSVFRVECGCPGCGDVDVHPFAGLGEDGKSAIRWCHLCNRQWIQG